MGHGASNIGNNQTYFCPTTWKATVVLLVQRVRNFNNFNQFNDLHRNIDLTILEIRLSSAISQHAVWLKTWNSGNVFVGMIHGLNHVCSKYRKNDG